MASFALQVVALRFGPLALDEPILVCDLIFAGVISAILRRHADLVIGAGVVACSAWVAGFLVIARPTVTDFSIKLVTANLTGGLGGLFGHWPIYAVAIIGPIGFVLNQNAFQAGTLLAPVLAIITITDTIGDIGLA